MYIVIERFPSAAESCIVADSETGLNKVYKTLEEAQTQADECQDGIVVEI